MKTIRAFALLTVIALSAPLSATAASLSEGLVKKVDNASQTITIRHGELKDLKMPAMTMAFRVKNASMLKEVKPGDRVTFSAAKAGADLVLTQIAVK